MAKESHKQSPRSRKENSGCIGGLFSMFDFRQGCYMPRLLFDSKLGDVRNSGFCYSRNKDDVSRNKEKNDKEAKNMASSSDIENDEARKVNLGVASIKTLLEEEMSRKHQSWNEYSPKNDWLKAGVGFEANADNSLKEQTVVGSDGPANELKDYTRLISRLSDYSNRSGMLSSDLDVAAFLEDYCSTLFLVKDDQSEFKNRTSQCSSQVNIEELKKSENADESATILQKAIIDIAKTLLKQKSINSSKLVEKTEAQQEEEFCNALEILNSNKDLFLMFLHDPDSPIRKHIQDLENIHAGKSSKINKKQTSAKISDSKPLHKGNFPYFVRKKEKTAEENHSNERSDDNTANRIFVLKPSSVSNQNHSNTVSMAPSVQSHHVHKNKEDVDGERLSYHFSLEDIKRRFRNAVGATQKVRRSIAMDGILHKIPYGKQTSCESENSSRKHDFERGDKKKSNAKEIEKKSEFSCSSNFFRERKKSSKNATPQMMYRETALYGEARKNLSESFRMDRKSKSLPDNQASKSLGRMLSFSEYNNLSSRLSPAREKAPESPREKASAFLFHVHQNFDANYLIPQNPEESFPNTEKSQKAKNGSMEIIEDEISVQIEKGSQLEASFESISNEDDLPSESFKEEGSSILLKPFEEMFQPSTPLTLMASSSTVAQEPRDTECSMESTRRPSPISVLEPHYFEDNSPTSMIRENESFAERKSVDKEPQIGSNPSTTTCIEFDEASLFDELEQSYGLSIDDPKLLFDLIDEVVGEIKERHRTFLWQRRSATPSLKQQDFYKQASKRIDWHSDVQFPSTVEQAAKKDIDGVAWFDSHLHLEAENVVNEVGNAILNYLFEETALELWD